MIVLDASSVIELLLNTEAGSRVRNRIADPYESLHAPHLLAVEVTQVMRRYASSRAVTPGIAEAALEDLTALDIEHYAHEPLLPRVWDLRDNMTANDAVYIALAEVLGAPLLTLDQRLAGAPGHAAVVETVA